MRHPHKLKQVIGIKRAKKQRRSARKIIQIILPHAAVFMQPAQVNVSLSLDAAKILINRFENDILYDCHGFTVRFERSESQRELVRQGKIVLRPIVEHLRANPPSDFMQLNVAWGKLLNWIEIGIDQKRDGPQRLDDTEGWIVWAEHMSML
jgi:hypothetical protein